VHSSSDAIADSTAGSNNVQEFQINHKRNSEMAEDIKEEICTMLSED
jgi:hypothetical protein